MPEKKKVWLHARSAGLQPHLAVLVLNQKKVIAAVDGKPGL